MNKVELAGLLMQLLDESLTGVDVENAELNCGTLWVTAADGNVYAVTVMETEHSEE